MRGYEADNLRARAATALLMSSDFVVDSARAIRFWDDIVDWCWLAGGDYPS